MVYAYLIGCLLVSYLLGSLNGSIIFSKIFKNADIRDSGSKNAGMTNTLRVFGKKAAVFVFLFDLFKAIGSVLLARFFANFLFMENSFGGAVEDIVSLSRYGQYLASLGAVLGHNFPLYFHFRGGKGILCGISVAFALDWRCALIIMGVFAVCFFATGYVSLGSVMGALAFAASFAAFYWGNPFVAIGGVFIGLLAVVMHHANIGRLLHGTERKARLFKKKA